MSQSLSPQSIEELQRILEASSENARPVYTYREGSNGGLLLDLSQLNQILEIDAANLVATVEPGVKLGILAAALGKQRLRFIPADTPFYQEKTVGQLFYEGCSNPSSLKYGPAKHFLMGSSVVLPTGEVLNTGGKTVKNVTGYDFTRFFNSPYTDYGITVKFILKLLPLPETRKSVAATFKEVKDVLAFTKALKDARIVADYLLWIDPVVQDIFKAGPEGELALMEFGGPAEEVLEQYQRTAGLIKEHGGTITEDVDGGGQTAGKWGILYRPSAMYVLTDEFKTAFNCQQQLLAACYQAAEDSGVPTGLFGQLAEGKINLVFASRPEDSFIDKINSIVMAAGGISSGKYARLDGKTGSGVLAELERQAKAAFDPKLILNCCAKEV